MNKIASKKMDKKKIINIILYLLLIGAIMAIVMPMLIGAGYTYPCEDDFSWEGAGKEYAVLYGDFFGALVGTYRYYVMWQGTYLANFLWFFWRPYDRGGECSDST